MRPGNDEALAVGTAQGFREQDTDDDAIVSPQDAERKLLATMQAEAAMQGVRVERLRDRGRNVYVVIRSGRAIDCCDLDAVRLAVRRLGGGA